MFSMYKGRLYHESETGVNYGTFGAVTVWGLVWVLLGLRYLNLVSGMQEAT